FNDFMESLSGIILSVKSSHEDSIQIKETLLEETSDGSKSINDIKGRVESFHNNISQLNNQISEVSSAALQISGNLDSFNNRIDNQVSAVEESTASIEEMIASLKNVASITRSKEQSSEQLIQTTAQGAELMNETSAIIQEVNSSISSIMEMTTLIDNIASQTNLLSMNAAIEAAHAGEAGKGFSVVAEEIRKLATDSSDSANRISSALTGIVERIGKAHESSIKTNRQFEIIKEETDDLMAAFREISGSTQEISLGGQEILSAMELLNDISMEVKNGSGEMKDGTHNVARSMDAINNYSTEISQAMNEVTSSTDKLNEIINQIDGLSVRMDRAVEKLGAQISQFKV
ncbi:MAG: methyl-accepting chemotaxis protein, partial [Spirochaetales bacterium]|nr:methyl-accepting chemotaxis protein [Spirochaetales bacterium]